MFKSSSVQQTILRNGFALIDNVGLQNKTEQLQKYIVANFQFSEAAFYYSLLNNSFEQNKTLQKFIKEILNDFYETSFFEYRTFSESFLSKPPQTSEELLLHQDFCYTNENKFPAYNIWIPLMDVNENNGAIFVLPGSHLWYKNYRSSSLPTARISMKKFLSHQIVKVNMKRGQALLFHPALFHGSFPNNTSENRVIVTATITHKEADFLYYHREEKSDEVEVYRLDEDAYLRDLKTISAKARPNAPLIEKYAYHHHEITEAELRAKAAEMLK